MRALYVSHNGMLESLGQAQVLPYLRGLARRGVDFDLFSYELPTAEDDAIEELRAELLATSGIRWTPLRRARDPRLRTKVIESTSGALKTLRAALARRPDVVHGRSYLPTAIADLVASAVPKARLVFDCRGMLGDEYVDAGYWTPDRLEYRLLKGYERRAFARAEGVVVLTEILKRIVLREGWLGSRSTIEAIPCCVDLAKFSLDQASRDEVRAELAVEGDLVIVYSGSLGGWYMEAELAAFVAMVTKASPRRVTFLVLSNNDTENLLALLKREGVARDRVVTKKVAPASMPRYLRAGDLALSFIKGCFSKLGSSPTKVAEYLACGLPVVVNGDIGDQAELAVERDACVVLGSLDRPALADAVPRALALAERNVAERVAASRDVAVRRFSLEDIGVARYERLYRAITR